MILDFDNHVFEALAESLDEVFAEIIDVFFEETESSIEGLKVKIVEKNIDDIHDIAHKIKSSTKTFGASGLVEILEQIENLKTFNNNDLLELHHSFKNEYILVKEYILNKMKQNS